MIQEKNYVNIIGRVGNIKISNGKDWKCARMSIATSFIYKDKQGAIVEEVTWHSVTAFEGEHCRNLEQIQKGTAVNIEGRLRNVRYTDQTGRDTYMTEIAASSISVVEENDKEN